MLCLVSLNNQFACIYVEFIGSVKVGVKEQQLLAGGF
jgi:hypothetical protein